MIKSYIKNHSKKFLLLVISVFVLVVIFVPTHFAYAWPFTSIITDLFTGISQLLMSLSSLVLIFSGMIFDWVVKFTVIDMAKNIGDRAGVGGAINVAWTTLRDVANMCFIFVLLFAAFKAMFQLDFGNIGTTIRNIIIVALLINFSLFFSKVVIDASNIVSLGFYNSIIGSNVALSGGSSGISAIGNVGNFKGISGGYMHMLGMQTLFSANILTGAPGQKTPEPGQILVIGIMSAVFMLITSVILFIAGIMFATRFIILIFLMILSPLALIAYIIPGMKDRFTEWRKALVDQSFFAPLFFALTWVVFKLGTALLKGGIFNDTDLNGQSADLTTMFSNPGGAVGLIVNYVLIIGFSIAALIFAKKMATSTAGFKIIAGGIGTAAMGGAGLAARNTIGRASSLVSEKYRDKWSQSTPGRAGLWLADKGKKGSFDVRGVANTGVGKAVGAGDVMGIAGKASGKGGFKQAVEDKAKAKTAYAKDVYGQTGTEKEKAAELEDKYNKGYKDENGVFQKSNKVKAEETEKTIKEKKAEQERRMKEVERVAEEAKKKAQRDLEAKKKEMNEAVLPETKDVLKKQVEEAEAKLKTTEIAHDEAISKKKLVMEEGKYSNEISLLEEQAKDLNKKAEVDKKIWEGARDMGKKRQEEFAKRVTEKSPISTATGATAGGALGASMGSVLGPIGNVVGLGVGAGIGAYTGYKAGRKFAPGVWKGNEESARKIIEEAKGKAKKDKKQLKKDLAKMGLIDDEEGSSDTESSEEKKTETPKTEEKTT